MNKNNIYIIILLLFSSLFLYSISFKSVDVHGGLIFIGNGETSDEDLGAPSPIKPVIGVGLPMDFFGGFELLPGISFFGLNYAFNEGPRPKPAQDEHREMYILSFMIEPTVAYPFPLSENLTIKAFAAPIFLIRIPAITAPLEPSRASEMNKYFYGKTRFFYPQLGGLLDWKFAENRVLQFRLRSYLPLFHAWDGEDAPFYDQMMISFDLGFRFLFNSKK